MSETSIQEPSDLTSSAEDSLARISRLQARVAASLARSLAYGPSTPGSFASYDRASSSWRTSQPSLFEDSKPCSVTWPRSGTMRGGTAFPLPPSAPLTGVTGSSWSRGEYPTPSATEYGSSQNEGSVPHDRPTRGTPSLSTWARKQWPTTTAGDAKSSGSRVGNPDTSAHPGTSLTDAVCRSGPPLLMTCTGGHVCRPALSPRFAVWLLGIPIDWLSSVPPVTR